MSKFFMRKCTNCAEPTKVVTGFWDGVNPATKEPTHGCFYDCENMECPEKQFAEAALGKSEATKAECHKKNLENGVDILRLRKARIAAKCTMRDAYLIANVEPHAYSDWEHERKPMDKDIYEILMDYFTEN